MVGKSNFQGCIHGLRARVGKKDMVEGIRGNGTQAIGHLKWPRMSHLKCGGKIQCCCLLGDRADNFWTAVAGIDTPQPGGAIENLTAINAPVVHPGCRNKEPRALLELAVGRKGHPEGVEVEIRKGGQRHQTKTGSYYPSWA